MQTSHGRKARIWAKRRIGKRHLAGVQTFNAISVRQSIFSDIFGRFPDKTRRAMNRTELGSKVRHVRERKHLTQQNMADALGMSSAKQYSRYETGESKLDMELLERIANEFELSVPELLAYDEGVSFNHCKQANSFSPNSSYHEASTKERELYEARIKELVERIKHLEGEVEFMRKTTKALPSRLEEK